VSIDLRCFAKTSFQIAQIHTLVVTEWTKPLPIKTAFSGDFAAALPLALEKEPDRDSDDARTTLQNDFAGWKSSMSSSTIETEGDLCALPAPPKTELLRESLKRGFGSELRRWIKARI
jgi:hypothetical protein